MDTATRMAAVKEMTDRIWAITNDADARAFLMERIATVQAAIDAGTWTGRQPAIRVASSDLEWCFTQDMSRQQIAMWQRALRSIEQDIALGR